MNFLTLRTSFMMHRLMMYLLPLFFMALSLDASAMPAASYDFTAAQTALPTDLTTMISNAKTLLQLGAGAAVGLAILRGAMFFVTGLCRSIISAAS